MSGASIPSRTAATEALPLRNRRRGKDLEAAIFEVVLRELSETGYVNFSIERVAARAATSKPVLYRRWPTRAQLVYAALRANRPFSLAEAPDTGTVRGDLMVILHSVSNMVDDLSPEVIFGLAAELLHESDSWERTAPLFAEVQERNAKIMTEILTRGIARGEIAAQKLTPRLMTLPFDLVRYQLMVLRQLLSPQDIEEIIDRIFLPLVRAD
jgi:AcrR family transcriptional regulator